jgi:hypothetical protein
MTNSDVRTKTVPSAPRALPLPHEVKLPNSLLRQSGVACSNDHDIREQGVTFAGIHLLLSLKSDVTNPPTA